MLTATEVKEKAKALGADLVGICSATTLNDFPPDPRWPQIPKRLWKECRSVIALGKRIPWGMFRATDLSIKRFNPLLVMNNLDQISFELSCYIEARGYHAFTAPQQYTDTDLKRGTYGSLSLRHVAVEAGLGTLGLNLMLLTPDYGPRVYLGAVLTDIELEVDSRTNERLCLGVSCGRCLLACPPDAVDHWGLNKRKCSTHAQPFGISALFSYLRKIFDAETAEEKEEMSRSLEVVDFWQALRVGAGAYGACPRCLEVCPVGRDYALHLKDMHSKIPEETNDKRERLKAMRLSERSEEVIQGFEISRRWIDRGSQVARNLPIGGNDV